MSTRTIESRSEVAEKLRMTMTCRVLDDKPGCACVVVTVRFGAPAGPGDKVVMESLGPRGIIHFSLISTATGPDSDICLDIQKWTMKDLRWIATPKRRSKCNAHFDMLVKDVTVKMLTVAYPNPPEFTPKMFDEFARAYHRAYKENVRWRYWRLWKKWPRDNRVWK